MFKTSVDENYQLVKYVSYALFTYYCKKKKEKEKRKRKKNETQHIKYFSIKSFCVFTYLTIVPVFLTFMFSAIKLFII